MHDKFKNILEHDVHVYNKIIINLRINWFFDMINIKHCIKFNDGRENDVSN
jgi:hypothetical protein